MKQLSVLIWVWVLANILIGSSFLLSPYFWVLFPLSLSILIYISYKLVNKDVKLSINREDLWIGILSGTLLYGVFFAVYLSIKSLNLPLLPFVQDLYLIVGPKVWWHYILLVLIIIPGEEIFWRRYMQPRLVEVFGGVKGVLAAACFYAFAHVWTANPMLVAAAATAGFAWGALYHWKKSVSLVIISHLVFDLWLLIIFPLNF